MVLDIQSPAPVQRLKRKLRVLDPDRPPDSPQIRDWLYGVPLGSPIRPRSAPSQLTGIKETATYSEHLFRPRLPETLYGRPRHA